MEGGYQDGSRLDSVAVARVTTVRREPESPSGLGGFAARAVAAQPQVPAWIAWLFEHVSEQLARVEYQMHYPLDHTGYCDQRTADEWLITQRAYHARASPQGPERAARYRRVRSHSP